VPRTLRRHLRWLPVFALLLAVPGAAGPVEDRLADAFRDIDTRSLATGVLMDRVVPVVDVARFDGGPGAPVATRGSWLQIYHQLASASADPAARPTAETLAERARLRRDAIPIALVFDRYERIRSDALARGTLTVEQGRFHGGGREAFEERTAFAAAALRPVTYGGAAIPFVLDGASVFSNAGARLERIAIDFDDGQGERGVSIDRPVMVRYAATGTKTLHLTAQAADGEDLHASFSFVVAALAAPSPDDTLHVTATIPYQSGVASGDAYVYLAPGRSTLLNPVVMIEGFDLDNSMNWDELYALLNQEQLIENLRADGYDAVVLNFTDATDYLQRNAFVVTELVNQVRAIVGPQTTIAMAGASMGGLLGRYALAYMETNGMAHSVRTFISFDGPQLGADIPLGIQYWVKFFSGQSTDAADLLASLNRPAARQMLAYFYTDPPTSSGQPDPLRGGFLADLAAVGSWPTQPRLVGIANGSNDGTGEPFAPGAQIIQYNYSALFGSIVLVGNVWAVPNGTSHTIFDGRIHVIIGDTRQTVTVSGTQPYDDAPGGWRGTMAQMDTTAVSYGDIIGLYPNHCFIPTVSALAYDSPDLFHDIAADANPLAHTPYDAIYSQATNQEHVAVTAENAAWIRSEVEQGVTGVEPGARAAALSLRAAPNPASGPVDVTFALPRDGAVDLRVTSVDGREVARLAEGTWSAGLHRVTWSARDRRGRSAPAGVYFVHLVVAGKAVETHRVVRIR
jgi:hypothetical protein